jgi:hypothetical protein
VYIAHQLDFLGRVPLTHPVHPALQETG